MKTFIKLFLSAILLTPLVFAGVATAHEAGTGHTHEAETMTATETSEGTEMTAEEKAAALKQRLEKRKTEVKTRITAAQKTRLQSRCKNSQGKLSSLQGRITGIETSRNSVYSNLTDRLDGLQTRLAAQNVNTDDFQTRLTELDNLITVFKADLANYKQTVSDLAEMDCAADPDAFKSSLDAARTVRKKVQDDAVAIKAYVKDTIRPTLQTLKTQLDDNSEAGTPAETEQEGEE